MRWRNGIDPAWWWRWDLRLYWWAEGRWDAWWHRSRPVKGYK